VGWSTGLYGSSSSRDRVANERLASAKRMSGWERAGARDNIEFRTEVNEALQSFHYAVREWFEHRFGTPSPIQTLGWPAIEAGHDALLCAATGSGKTLAAFLWALDYLVVEAERGTLRDEVTVVYVSPLKALANDVRANLEEPLTGIRQTAARRGTSLPEVRAAVRTGDTLTSERGAMLRRPPHILVTTPESLFILLTSQRFRSKLSRVRFVIVDELHALAGNKRGAHLAITLERLDKLVRDAVGTRPTRIGLSATLSPIERLGQFLCGADAGADDTPRWRPFRCVRADTAPRAAELKLIAPGPPLGPLATHEHWEAMYDEIAKLVRAYRTTLIFTLSRRWAERIALSLQKRLGTDAVMAHHGSLARAERLKAEQRLKRGELKAIVATSSLELGIDVGAVELVCQVDSPKSISAAIQRIGRSGHMLGEKARGQFFALTIDDLLECAAVVRAMGRGRLDEVEIPRGCLDVAAQQIVAIAAELGEVTEAELLRLLRGAYNFTELDRRALARLLEEMAQELPEQIRGAQPKIFYDPDAGVVRPRRGARLTALSCAGTIPESGNYDVVIESEGRKIGEVEEDFAQESSRGDIFALGSMPWQIQRMSRGRLMVEPAPGMAPTLPFWQSEANGRSPALSAELCELRAELAARIAGEGAERAEQWLCCECAMDRKAAAQAVRHVRAGLAALGVLPDFHTLVVERFFDGLGTTQVVVHSPFGMRFNRGFGLALRKRLCRSFNFEIQASATDDGVLLSLNSRHSFAPEELLAMVTSRSVGRVLSQAVLDAPMFEARFRHVACRALSLTRRMGGRNTPAWIQRLRAQDLLVALFPNQQACFENRPPEVEIPEHFVIAETMRECLEESADLPRLEAFLTELEAGRARFHAVDSLSPSVMAQRLLLAWDYAFLDDGERANRRSRSVSMSHGLVEQVLDKGSLAHLLDREAAERVAAEASALDPRRQARDGDELYELLRAHGALTRAALAKRAAPTALEALAELEQRGRLVRFQVGLAGNELIAARADLPLFRAVYPDIRTLSPAGAADSDKDLILDEASTANAPLATTESDGIAPKSMLPEGSKPSARRTSNGIATPHTALGAPARDGEVQAANQTGSERAAPTRDSAVEELTRRALKTSGPVSAEELAARLELKPAELTKALAALEGQGVVFRGHYTNPRIEQWCERYNLERIHRLTLERLRGEIEPCDEAEFVDFLLRWHRVGGHNLEPGIEGAAFVLERLQGLAYAPEFWEEAILRARVPDYRAEYLDLLCASGRFIWVGVPHDDTVRERPARVALLPRASKISWPLAAQSDVHLDELPVYQALTAGGAQFLDQLCVRAGLTELEVLNSLWRLAHAGMVTNDNFAPLRMSAPSHSRRRRSARRRRWAATQIRLRFSMAGRWSAVSKSAASPEGAAENEREIALKLLNRHGVLARETLEVETAELKWGRLLFVLRRLEYAGAVRRGYFVRALSGEQYALPEAVELLRLRRRRKELEPRPVAISAADPANPYGAMLAGMGVAREAANVIVFDRGRPLLALAGGDLRVPAALEDTEFTAALSTLLAFRRKVKINTIDGEPALRSPRAAALASMKFHSDGAALTYDGLPGPSPRGLPAARSVRLGSSVSK
jgi:ATP-dependent Lhr-like helicase